MKYNYTILLILLFLSNGVFGQGNQIIGQVTDEAGLPLPKVEIYWSSDFRQIEISGEDGTYKISFDDEIEKDKNVQLVFEADGMETESRSFSQADNFELNVTMKKKGVTSVTASRWEQSVYEIPASTIIVSRQEIEENGYLTLQEILENIPGVFTIDHRYASDVTIGIRGFWADFNRNVMIQVNGVNMLSERRNDFPLDKINVPVEAIDKVEIVRGPMSVIYGAGAFFGVINIITNDMKIGTHATLTTGFGTQMTQKNMLRYTVNKGGLKLSFNAMSFQRNGFDEEWNDMVTSGRYDFDAAQTYTGYPNATTISDYEDSMVGVQRYSRKHYAFNMSAEFNEFFFNVNYAHTNKGFSYIFPGPKSRNYYKPTTGNYQVGYRKSIFAKKLDLEFKASYMKSNVPSDNNYYVDSAYVLGEDRMASYRLELNTRTALIQGDEEDPNALNIDLFSGLYFSSNIENGSFYNGPEQYLRNWYVGLAPDGHVDTKAAYVQTEIKKGKLNIIGGIRAEHESGYLMLSEQNGGYNIPIDGEALGIIGDTVDFSHTTYTHFKPGNPLPHFIPRAAIIYEVAKNRRWHHYMKLMYGQGAREINVVQNAHDIMQFNKSNEGNPLLPQREYLDSEKTRAIEAGYTFVDDTLNLEINANIFNNYLVDLITRDGTIINSKYYTKSQNTQMIRTLGLELSARMKFTPKMKGPRELRIIAMGSLTLQTSQLDTVEFDDVGHAVSFSPPVLATLNITGRYSAKNDPKAVFIFGVGANYVGEMRSYYARATTLYPTSIFENNHYLSSSEGDLTTGITDDYIRVSLNLRVSNIRWGKIESGGLFINAKCSNLLGAKYFYPTYSNNSWGDQGVLGRGRQIVLSIGYKF